jgi:hypothetical protein
MDPREVSDKISQNSQLRKSFLMSSCSPAQKLGIAEFTRRRSDFTFRTTDAHMTVHPFGNIFAADYK